MGILSNLYDKVTGIASEGQKAIGKEQITRALTALQKYKQGKASLERRIIEDEKFYKLQYWDYLSHSKPDAQTKQKPSTAWMLNSIVNKHADIMDSYPEANCLPREVQDKQDAQALSEIIPVVMEHNAYEQTYSDIAWYYIKHGVCCQGVFWDGTKDNGLGDITIKNVDILNLFWEPGITNLQDSQNLFYVSMVDNDALHNAYPDYNAGQLTAKTVNISEYIYDDSIDNSDKSVIVDWYYKKTDALGRTILHYVKFVGDTILFASENEPEQYPDGYYAHGEYPFTMSTMYPEAGTPYGFGIISVCRDPQLYIDTLDGLMIEYLNKISKPRYWVKKDAGVNQKDFLDWDKPLVEVQGNIEDEKLKQITISPLGSAIQNLRQMKVDELKETSSNRDFSQGSTSSGVTSGAAIATLQEAGNKTTRDMLKSLYRGYVDVVRLSIELIRQFYDETREFRITGYNGMYQFTQYSNQNIKEQQMPSETGEVMYRKPIFDIDVKAQKANPYSKQAQNETAVNLYNMGIFNPQNAQMALGMLDMMDFEGKEKVKEFVMQGQTMQNVINQQNQQLMQMSQIISQYTHQDLTAPQQDPQEQPMVDIKNTDNASKAFNNASNNKKTPYAQQLKNKGNTI